MGRAFLWTSLDTVLYTRTPPHTHALPDLVQHSPATPHVDIYLRLFSLTRGQTVWTW